MKIPTVKELRTKLGLSQRQMADLLAVSKKAIESYEQGWRRVPPHVEQLLLLHTILNRGNGASRARNCWEQRPDCDPAVCARCPAHNSQAAGFCWLVTGTLCGGEPTANWAEKRDRCLECDVLLKLLNEDTTD